MKRSEIWFILAGLITVSLTALGLLTIVPQASARVPPPAVASAQVQIPVVTDVLWGCTSHRALVSVHMVTPPGQNHSDHVVHISGWFDGAWRDDPTLAVVPSGILVSQIYGRWHASIDTAWNLTSYTITGPDSGPFGDPCSTFVDSIPVASAT